MSDGILHNHNNLVILVRPSSSPAYYFVVISGVGCSDQFLIVPVIAHPGELSRNWAIKCFICT